MGKENESSSRNPFFTHLSMESRERFLKIVWDTKGDAELPSGEGLVGFAEEILFPPLIDKVKKENIAAAKNLDPKIVASLANIFRERNGQ